MSMNPGDSNENQCFIKLVRLHFNPNPTEDVLTKHLPRSGWPFEKLKS